MLGIIKKASLNKKTVNAQKENKYIHLEIMRIIAIFFVIFNHTGLNGFFLFALEPVGSIKFWIYLFFSVACKFSVPVFFAISGALLLGKKDESLGTIWKKRILKMVLLLITYSFINYIRAIAISSQPFNAKDLFTMIYNGSNDYLWYLYAYIGYLASLPFLRALVNNLETKYYYYMIAIALFFNGIIPVIEQLCWAGKNTLSINIKITWLITITVLYPCIGYFMQNKFDIKKKTIMLLWILNIAGIVISCFMTYYKGQKIGFFDESESQMFHNSFVILNCMSIFTTIKYLCERIKFPKLANKIILSVGACTFGIYLTHQLVLDLIPKELILVKMVCIGFNDLIAVFIVCFLVMFTCYCITYILKKIPILKKLVGG